MSTIPPHRQIGAVGQIRTGKPLALDQRGMLIPVTTAKIRQQEGNAAARPVTATLGELIPCSTVCVILAVEVGASAQNLTEDSGFEDLHDVTSPRMQSGRLDRTRTCTGQLLKLMPLLLGYEPKWLPRLDSHQHERFQRASCYCYITGQIGAAPETCTRKARAL